ncbi:MAG TPA: serine/threonine-protein kinase, partial [Planctomycetota bacterium]|nr:serine/threonine-protein kinase [Planctomycetota bacterium]
MLNETALSAANTPLPEIPGYRLEAVLGRGSTGTVYRAVQLAVDRAVALKVLHPELAGSKAVRRLQREARTTARLAHPGIVSAIDMGQVGGLWWYAMELIDGPALSALLREKGKLREREALKLFIPLCEALEHVHEHGVVHRDIKPANILVDTHGRARLVDLGLAFTEDDPLLTRTGGTLGTPHYLSPEQARNPQSVDIRSDIWSLGASMYHAMCGRPPFTGESVAEILSGVLYARIADPREVEPSLSPGMSLVLRKCLTRNQDKRYSNPSELLRDLEALRERRTVAVSARSLDPVAGERERRRKYAWIGAGVLVVAATTGVILWKPWAAAAPTNGLPVASEASWPQLDLLLAQAKSGERSAAGAVLESLDAMKDSVPPQHITAYWNARAALQSQWEEAVKQEKKSILGKFEIAFTQERDFHRAAQFVALEVESRLANEFGANEAQRRRVAELLDFDAKRKLAAAEEKEALNRFRDALNKHYNDVIVPAMDNDLENGKWRDALQRIQRPVPQVIASADIKTTGISPANVEQVINEVGTYRIDVEVKRIAREWAAKDLEIQGAVNAKASRIEELLSTSELGADAVAALEKDFELVLKNHSLTPLQMLPEVSNRGGEALELAKTRLKQKQAEFLIRDANAELKSADERLVPLWKDRQYAQVAADWEKRLAEEWLAPVHDQIQLRMEEARLLEDLLQRAVRGLKTPGLDSILVGSFLRKGKIFAGDDPLKEGFQQEIAPGKRETYHLRAPVGDSAAKLSAAAIELLAGLANDPKDEPNSLDRLARALFRMREGDPDTAVRVFESGPKPNDTHAALVADLESRLSKAHVELSAKVEQREKDAEQEFSIIQREQGYTREVPARIKRINDFLATYADTECAKEHGPALRDLKQALEGSLKISFEDKLRSNYGPEISFPAQSKAQLNYSFTSEASPRWNMGDWKRSAEGWSADRLHSRAELEDEKLWPRLLLEEPLDLNAAMIVEIEFEQPQSSGTPRRFVVSIAGVHVGFAGPPEAGASSLVASKAGGADAMKDL